MLGVSFVFAREILDPTLSDEAAAAAELKVPVLTPIPIVGSTRRKRKLFGKGGRKQISLVPASGQAESELTSGFSIQGAEDRIREVIFGRSGMAYEQYQMMQAELFSQKQPGSKRSLIVTSAIPDEGKTFVACCLAAMLGKQQEKKVLLIDGDLRTGSAGQVLGFTNGAARMGLGNVLAGETDVENCLVPCADLNLWFLPAGRSVDNPVELLGSPRLEQIMRDLTLLFDWVIVDSPPVLPLADTSVLNTVCGAALVVVRADRTPVSLAREAIDKIGRERVFGIVLNYVRELKIRNYYGRYYGQMRDQVTELQK
jgi:capsular exopolysaccharide synthesis family protein